MSSTSTLLHDSLNDNTAKVWCYQPSKLMRLMMPRTVEASVACSCGYSEIKVCSFVMYVSTVSRVGNSFVPSSTAERSLPNS